MPQHLKELIALLFLATAAFAFAKVPACTLACRNSDFDRRRILWFLITLAAFLAHNFWVYIVVVGVLLVIAFPREPNKLALYYFVLFAVPPMAEEIGGLGMVNFLFSIHYLRLLALAVLLPAYLSLRSQPETVTFGRLLPDKLLLGLIILSFSLQVQVDTLTNALRQGLFYPFIDVFLPYYVASRYLKDLRGFRDALMSFIVAATVIAVVGIFEFARHWLLYSSLADVLGVLNWGYGNYLERGDGLLRAQASTGQPIVLGYAIMVALGLVLWLGNSVRTTWLRATGLALLAAGLLSPLARGPWVGAVFILVVFIATGHHAVRRLMTLAIVGLAAFPLLLVFPTGQKLVDYLPFVGSIDAQNVSYRQQLLETSIQLFLQSPLFGVPNFRQSLAMRGLTQGQGIVDLVNTYLSVALSTGVFGLLLFVGFFIVVAIGLVIAMRRLPDRQSEQYKLGQTLLSTLLGILVVIFTVASVSVIPIIYWSVAGLGVAYARMVAPTKPSSVPEGRAR